MHTTLVPSGVVEVASLQTYDSPLRIRQSASGVRGTDASRWGGDRSYSKRGELMARKGIVEHVGKSSND